MNLNKLFKRVKPQHRLGDRVAHKEQNRRGTVTGHGVVDGTLTIITVNVRFDDGGNAYGLPSNEFTNLTRSTY